MNDVLNSISNEDFNFLVKNGKRTSILLNFDFESLIYSSWGMIKETIPELCLKGEFDKLFYLMLKERGVNVFVNDLHQIPFKKAVAFILWIKDEMNTIQELEKTYLVSSPSAKMFSAGINKLDQFGILNTIDNLAGGDIFKYDEVKKLRYSLVFDKQYREIIKSEITEKLAKQK